MARTRVRLSPGLAERLAAGPVRREVGNLTDAISREAKDRAPAAKTWVTDGGENVRPSHAHADGQTIPENLSYQLPSMEYVRKGRDASGKAVNRVGGWKVTDGVDLARTPRDPTLPVEQRINCDCQSRTIPGALAAATRSTTTVVTGTRVHGGVECVFHRVGEAEFGSSQDSGTHFMAIAAAAVVARRRA
ncbi:hypothetical protein GCM10022252_75740 [Streptosporangium oxazolinicum]|uniref:Uncharacterized protein n=1 Tax=Streptosporangium oxazolinicum TaxID=909287 RepID=A0ABP8BKS7_9ACTN